MTQRNYLSNLLKRNPDAVFVGSLGTICYDLDELKPKNYIRVAGAMGCSMGIALGYALNTTKKVICIIGDGAYLMKMGTVSTIMAYKPKNLKIYIMVNRVYASTGGQKVNKIVPLPPKSHFELIHIGQTIDK